MSSWKKVTLEDISESINTGLDAIRRAPIVDFETDIKCLRIQDISQNKPIESWGFTEVKNTDYSKFRLMKDDIIMARTCSTGICFLAKQDLPAVTLSQILCKHPFQLNGDRLSDHQNQS
ncbi:hypothetical protein [Glaesserella parasuis]|uniref:hypothetical protein n=1 Tax=Glaesserella parasuis TaxID=738 RepID=UPI0013663783|nr:hypothetical protein [Glaesserella parasuis]